MINKLLSHIDYKTLFNSLGQGIVYIDHSGLIAFQNKAAEQMFAAVPSFRTGESVYHQPWHLFTKRDEPLANNDFPAIAVLKTHRSVSNAILKIALPERQPIWLDVNADPVAAENSPGIAGVILTLVDLTETMTEKQRLRSSEEKYRRFFLSNKSATFLATKEGQYLDVGLGAETLFGYTVDELKTIGRDRIIVQDENFEKAVKQRNERGSVVAEVEGRRKDGSVFPMLWHANLFTTSAGEELVSVVMIDLTEKAELEKQAERSKYNLDLVLKNTDYAFAIVDRQLRFVTFNNAYRRTIETLYNQRIDENACLLDLFAAAQKEKVEKTFAEVFAGSQKLFTDAATEGEAEVYYETTLQPLKEGSRVIGAYISRRNVTQIVAAIKKTQDLQFSLDLVMENSEDGIAVLDANYVVQSVNEPFNKTMQLVHGRKVVPGDCLMDFINSNRKPFLEETFKEVLRGEKKELTFETTNGRGEPMVYLSALLPLCKDGHAVGIFILSKDVTAAFLANREAAAVKARLERAATASYDIISERNLKTGAVKRNEAFREVLGYNESDFAQPAEAELHLIHPDDRQAVTTAIAEQMAAGHFIVKLPVYRVQHRDGHCVYVDTRMMVTRDESGEPYLLTTVASDVTEFLQLQRSLVEANEALQRQTEDLKRSNTELERFAYVASHDLQEPLRMVSSFLSLIKKRYNSLLDDTGRQYIHFATDGALRMKALIQDLLQFSRIGTDKGNKEPVDTAKLVNGLLDEFVFTVSEKGAKISVKPLPVVLAVKSNLTHVFQNLLSNALKYATHPEIEIGAEEEEEEWRFYVKDNGIGIDAKFFEKIFVLFQQLHTKNEYSGTGIGLAIVKKIIDQSGGRIWVESAVGQGSTFFFTVPKSETNNP